MPRLWTVPSCLDCPTVEGEGSMRWAVEQTASDCADVVQCVWVRDRDRERERDRAWYSVGVRERDRAWYSVGERERGTLCVRDREWYSVCEREWYSVYVCV